MASWKGSWNQYSSSDDDIRSPDVSEGSLGPQPTPPSSLYNSDDLEYIEFMEGPKEPSETDSEEEHPENHEEDEEEEEDDDEDVDDSDGDDDDFDESDNDDNGDEKSTVSGKKYPRQDNGRKVASKKKKE
ncbi:hypothetical protein ACQJBY_035177 [Aegilops geniculata]